jgi:hypothetical protein
MMAIRFVLGQHGKVDFVSTSLLKQQSAGRYIDRHHYHLIEYNLFSPYYG